jgi:hypothetical protein
MALLPLPSSSEGRIQKRDNLFQPQREKADQKDQPEHLRQDTPGIAQKMNKQEGRNEP